MADGRAALLAEIDAALQASPQSRNEATHMLLGHCRAALLEREIPRGPHPSEAMAEKYYELLYAVARKWPGESRHETALRYIREAERVEIGEASAALADAGQKGKE